MECVFYHWWSEDYDVDNLGNNLRTPIIYSIASLRAVDPTIPIYVLDGSCRIHDWSKWSNIFNFQVIPNQFYYGAKYQDKAGYKHLSRIDDLWLTAPKVPERFIIYSDSDVFWIRSPRPTCYNGQKFTFNKFNTGFFYYDKESTVVKNFHEIWRAYIITALNDENFRIISRQYIDFHEWYFVLDESVLAYMAYKIPDFFDIVDTNEHCTVGMAAQRMPSPEKIKMLHAHGMLVNNIFANEPHARGLTPLLIKECWDSMQKIGQDRISLLYSTEFLDRYLPCQRSLFDEEFQRSLIASVDTKGLCRLTQALGLFN